jgi:predicted Zn-dependent protease
VRYTRHELKQDKFAETAMDAVHEVLEHRSDIIRIASVVVVLAVLAGGAYWYVGSRQAKAADALGQAMNLYTAQVLPPGTPPQGSQPTFHSDRERLIAARAVFYGISDKYGWTRSGQYAHYMAAVSEMQLGNDKVAEDQLLSVSRSRNGQVASLAKYALAGLYRDQKRDQDVVKLLQALADKPTAMVPRVKAQLALADLYTAQNQPDKAKVILDQIAKENPKNSLGEIAKEYQPAAK